MKARKRGLLATSLRTQPHLILNRAILQGLRQKLPPEQFAQVTQLVIMRMREWHGELRTPLTHIQMERLAHLLKGSLGMLGFDKLCNEASAIVEGCRRRTPCARRCHKCRQRLGMALANSRRVYQRAIGPAPPISWLESPTP